LVRPEVIRKRLNKLDEYLSILNDLQKYSYSEFVGDPEHYGSVERFLQLAIEAITDVGNHVVADLGLGVVNWYSDIPTILADSGYIDTDMKERWIQIIGFRNVLVHDYLQIDRQIVYDVLQHRLEDLRSLRKVFAQFL
jgi:uncharacterized protein YutE (UPF0331/DUF86 family)